MLSNGRDLFLKAVNSLNESKLLNFNVKLKHDVSTCNIEQLTSELNYFLDSVETVSENKEQAIPKNVINFYNNAVDLNIDFSLQDVDEKVLIDVNDITFRRTKFHIED